MSKTPSRVLASSKLNKDNVEDFLARLRDDGYSDKEIEEIKCGLEWISFYSKELKI